jgi:hypothetical protein
VGRERVTPTADLDLGSVTERRYGRPDTDPAVADQFVRQDSVVLLYAIAMHEALPSIGAGNLFWMRTRMKMSFVYYFNVAGLSACHYGVIG